MDHGKAPILEPGDVLYARHHNKIRKYIVADVSDKLAGIRPHTDDPFAPQCYGTVKRLAVKDHLGDKQIAWAFPERGRYSKLRFYLQTEELERGFDFSQVKSEASYNIHYIGDNLHKATEADFRKLAGVIKSVAVALRMCLDADKAKKEL